MTHQYEITRAAELETLPVFRHFIKDVCLQEKIDEETCFEITLAVDEACTNVITHGYANLNPGSIILTLDANEQEVVVTITDFGHAFEPSDAPMPDVTAALEDRQIGGFGLFLIYQTMDNVAYESSVEGNVLTLVKRLKQRSEAA